jgi:homeobox-leucine zipper protein
MRELAKKSPRCPGCGAAAASTEEQQLRLENAMLRAEVRSRAPPCRQLFFSPLRVVASTDTVTHGAMFNTPCHSD